MCELGSGARTVDPDAQWIVHLGMTGRLLVTTPDAPVESTRTRGLSLESGRELRFVDPRRFGRLEFRELCRHRVRLERRELEPLAIGTAEFAALFRGTANAGEGSAAEPEPAVRGG